jgi:DNA-binding NtrC family response regulator
MTAKKKILVVDDEAGILNLMADVFLGAGYEVTMALNGQKAMLTLTREFFDLVVTDINMPVWNGLDLLRWMKATGRKEKVIVMSGSPSLEDLSGSDIHPVDACFVKPFRIPSMLESVGEILTLGSRRFNPGSIEKKRELPDRCSIS